MYNEVLDVKLTKCEMELINDTGVAGLIIYAIGFGIALCFIYFMDANFIISIGILIFFIVRLVIIVKILDNRSMCVETVTVVKFIEALQYKENYSSISILDNLDKVKRFMILSRLGHSPSLLDVVTRYIYLRDIDQRDTKSLKASFRILFDAITKQANSVYKVKTLENLELNNWFNKVSFFYVTGLIILSLILQ